MKMELTQVLERNAALKGQRELLLANPQALERFARERYYMRRANEEVYRIVD